MPRFEDIFFESSTGINKIHARICRPDSEPRAIVQIVHGIAEYIDRYDPFMEFLADNGYLVLGEDHLGHGKSAERKEDLGFFADADGWHCVLKDMDSLRNIIRKEYPELPYVFFGHSMGSFLTRTYIIENPENYDAAVICGTGQMAKAMILGGYALAAGFTKLKGARADGTVLNNIAFSSYNDKFPESQSPFAWLSRNEENVENYANDPLCGFAAKAGLYRDMMGGMKFVAKQANINKMSKEQPILFISGAMDPVGDYGKGVGRAYAAFCRAGLKDVKMKLYKDDRHEILNEIDREKVFSDVLAWLNEKAVKA